MPRVVEDSGDVSVVIVNYNAGHHLARCVESLGSLGSPELREIVVVDNLSTDDSLDGVDALGVARILRNPDNRGLASANNQGILATSAPIVLFCNPDIVFGADAVAELAACFRRHPRAALVGGRLVDADGRVRTSVGELPRFRHAMLGRVSGGRFYSTRFVHDEEIQVGHVVEAFYAVRREASAETGGLDEGFFLYWEGADWAARFGDAGWDVWFCPTAEVQHVGGVTVEAKRFRWILWSHKSMYRYFRKHSRIPAAVLAPVIAARAVFKLGWAVVGSPPTQQAPVPTAR